MILSLLHAQAEKRIRTRLVLEAVAKAENIEISDEKLDEELHRLLYRLVFLLRLAVRRLLLS